MSPVSKPSLKTPTADTGAPGAASVTSSCGASPEVPSVEENAAPSELDDSARKLTVPSPVTAGVTSTSYQLPGATSSSLSSTARSPGGAEFQVTLSSRQELSGRWLYSPPTVEPSVLLTLNLAPTIWRPARPDRLNFSRSAVAGLESTFSVVALPKLLLGAPTRRSCPRWRRTSASRSPP